MEEKKVKMIVRHKKGQTIVTNESGQECIFSNNMTDETIIASLVFQTIYYQFTMRKEYSSDFTLEFTMEEITPIP